MRMYCILWTSSTKHETVPKTTVVISNSCRNVILPVIFNQHVCICILIEHFETVYHISWCFIALMQRNYSNNLCSLLVIKHFLQYLFKQVSINPKKHLFFLFLVCKLIKKTQQSPWLRPFKCILFPAIFTEMSMRNNWWNLDWENDIYNVKQKMWRQM